MGLCVRSPHADDYVAAIVLSHDDMNATVLLVPPLHQRYPSTPYARGVHQSSILARPTLLTGLIIVPTEQMPQGADGRGTSTDGSHPGGHKGGTVGGPAGHGWDE